MKEDVVGTESLRILLQQQRTGFYLQPSGEWGAKRDSAREFDDSVAAYSWAKEQGLLGSSVLMAVDQQQYDTVLACL